MAARRGVWASARFLHRNQLPGEKEKNALTGSQPPPAVLKRRRPNPFRALGKAFFSSSPALGTHGAQKRAKAHSPGLFQVHARVSFIISGFPAYPCLSGGTGFPAYPCLSGGTGFPACGTRGETPRLHTVRCHIQSPSSNRTTPPLQPTTHSRRHARAGPTPPAPGAATRWQRLSSLCTDSTEAPRTAARRPLAHVGGPSRPAKGRVVHDCQESSCPAGGPSRPACSGHGSAVPPTGPALAALHWWHRLSSLWDAGRDAPPACRPAPPPRPFLQSPNPSPLTLNQEPATDKPFPPLTTCNADDN